MCRAEFREATGVSVHSNTAAILMTADCMTDDICHLHICDFEVLFARQGQQEAL